MIFQAIDLKKLCHLLTESDILMVVLRFNHHSNYQIEKEAVCLLTHPMDRTSNPGDKKENYSSSAIIFNNYFLSLLVFEMHHN